LLELTDNDFHETLAQLEWVLVDYWADWCAPCKRLKPILESLVPEFPEITFATLDTDNNETQTLAAGMSSLPTLILFHHGVSVGKLVGVHGKEFLKGWIAELREIYGDDRDVPGTL